MEYALLRGRRDAGPRLAAWAERVQSADPSGVNRLFARFPYFELLARWHGFGKAFVPRRELEQLDRLSLVVLADRPSTREALVLERFLGLLLDRHRGLYSYESAIAMDFVARLSMPPGLPSPVHASRRIAQARMLIADLLAYEAASLLERGARWAGEGAPAVADGIRRVRLLRSALAGIDPILELSTARREERANAAADAALDDVTFELRAALAESSAVLRTAPAETLFLFRLSLIPVSLRHDEVMFLRMLQVFELLFNIVLRRVREAITALGEHDSAFAAAALAEAAAVIRKSPLLFRVLFTMTRESFTTFRELTRGSSAIQSRQYKLIELLCARPDPARLRSLAFASLTAEELDAVTLEEAVAAYAARRGPDDDGLAALQTSMAALERETVVWKRTHHRLAERLIGDLPGTGGTEGAEYLRRYVDTPLFPSLHEHAGARSG